MAEGAAPGGRVAEAGGAAFRSIGELAELCGHYCWMERRIFELTGSRASGPAAGDLQAGDLQAGDPEAGDLEAGDPEVRVVLSEMSARHGFLAAQWRDRLPVRAGVDVEALIVPPPGPFGEALDLVEHEPRLALVLGGLATQLLPRQVDGYRQHLSGASPVNEAPVRAVLEWAVLSTAREIRTAGLLLERLAPEGERARSVENLGALLQRLLSDNDHSFPGARAS
jgi:hypothetical protein